MVGGGAGAGKGLIQGQNPREPGRTSLYPEGESEDERDDPHYLGQSQKQYLCLPPTPTNAHWIGGLRESDNHRLSR